MRVSLERKATDSARLLSENLSLPLYNYDKPVVLSICKSTFGDADIRAVYAYQLDADYINIRLNKNGDDIHQISVDQPNTSLLWRTNGVFYKEEMIGMVVVGGSTERLKSSRRRF